MENKFSLGLDYGTSSVRVIIDKDKPHLARQDSRDYIAGFIESTSLAIQQAKARENFSTAKIIGIGVDDALEYKELHDAFGVKEHNISLYPVMKELLRIREKVGTVV